MKSVYRAAEAIAEFGRARVRRELDRGTWARPERGVVITHNSRPTRTEELEIALAISPPGSVVGGATALALDGFDFDAHAALAIPHIVIPEGSRRPATRRAIFHWSTKLGPQDVHPTRKPPRTRVARSVVDQAAWSSTDRGARVVVLAAAQQGLVLPRDMREALTRRGTCRWRRVIVQSILDAAGGVQSLPERDFAEIVRRSGFPPASRQARVQRSDGRCYLDEAWDEFDAACELHGIPHMEVSRWDADLDRANDIVAAGRRLLVFSSFAIRHRPDDVARQLGELLRRGGWETA